MSSFEVVSYVHPTIFVRETTTGKISNFAVDDEICLVNDRTRFDQGPARRAAISYLFKLRQAREACGENEMFSS